MLKIVVPVAIVLDGDCSRWKMSYVARQARSQVWGAKYIFRGAIFVFLLYVSIKKFWVQQNLEWAQKFWEQTNGEFPLWLWAWVRQMSGWLYCSSRTTRSSILVCSATFVRLLNKFYNLPVTLVARPVTRLGHQRGEKFSERGPNFSSCVQ